MNHKQILIDLFPIRIVRKIIKKKSLFFLLLKKIKSLDRDTSSTNNSHDEMLVSAQSRLKSDFEVIGIIGRGGFGHVFKVKFFKKIKTNKFS